jgi:RND family efflux transporter MFP subunit
MALPLKSDPPDLSRLRIDDSKRKPRAAGKWLGLFAAAVGIIVIGLGATSALRNRRPEVEVAVAMPPSDKPLATTLLNASGYVTPRRRATVAAKITGKVSHIYVDEGMRVTQGQVLATLDDSDYQVALASDKADRDATFATIADLEVQLGNAQRELKRTQQLSDAGVQTAQALDAAQTLENRMKAQIAQAHEQVKAADSKMSIDRQNIENCIVRSPFDGIAVSKDAQPGEMVSPISAGGGFTRTGISTIVDMNSNEIEVDVNENYIARVKPGQKVIATLDAYPDWQIPSHVRTIIPTADREKGTVKVRASFDHLDPRILPDMGVKVAFLDEEPVAKKNGLKDEKSPASKAVAMVPPQAVHTVNGQSNVFLFRDGTLERRAVRTGAQRGPNVEVLAGVAPGDIVVINGPPELHDGEQVTKKQ